MGSPAGNLKQLNKSGIVNRNAKAVTKHVENQKLKCGYLHPYLYQWQCQGG